MRDARPALAPKARLKWDRHDGKHMLLYPERGLSLNESAGAILEMCDGARTVADIARELAARAGDDATKIEADVIAFLRAMKDRGLVTWEEP